MSTFTICPSCKGINRVPIDDPAGKAPICGRCKTSLPFHGGVTDLSDATLNTFLEKSSLPVVVDFWAPWCGPCKVFAPTFLSAAREMQGRIVFAKLDTEAQQRSAQSFQIRSIPTLIKFKNGKEVDRKSGALALPQLLQWIKE